LNEENAIDNAEYVLAVRDYEIEAVTKEENMVDYTVSPKKSDDKILVRVITDSSSITGYVGKHFVTDMNNLLECQKYKKGILVGKKFTESAIKEMKRYKIEMISENCRPHFSPIKLLSIIDNYTQKICKKKCGQTLLENSNCKGYVNGNYCCDVRLTSDNADFHFKHGWTKFLVKDLMRLLAIMKCQTDLN
jgi:hypothetical protein